MRGLIFFFNFLKFIHTFRRI